MALAETLALQDATNKVATRYAGLMAMDARRGAQGALRARSGKLLRSIKPAIKEDMQTGWIYATGVKARTYGFILNYGQIKPTGAHKRTSKLGTSYSVRQYSRKLAAKPFLNAPVQKLAPRMSRELAARGAKAIVKPLAISMTINV